MPFTTGTAATPSVLLNAINTHLIANGWTNIRGETDMACASPKAARYWRINVSESETTTDNYRELKHVGFKTALLGAVVSTNGANWSCSSAATGGTVASLATPGGTAVRSALIYDGPWSCTYDFGSATIVREVDIECGNDGYAPYTFQIQWSNDNVTWTTMEEMQFNNWVDNETQTFSWVDTYVSGRHVSGTEPRRTGRNEDYIEQTLTSSTSTIRDMSEDYWVWQGPGYDASRRVYIHARGHTRTEVSTHTIEWDFSINYDGANPQWNASPGSTLRSTSHIMNSDPVDYWLYSNSKRIVLVTRSGAQDYASTYIGFLSAFAAPTDYPFPLFLSTTSPDLETYDAAVVNARLSMCIDPGLDCARLRLWDSDIRNIENRSNNAASHRYLEKPEHGWVWPFHSGSISRENWPNGQFSDWADYVGPHMFDFVVPTEQDHLPMFPSTVQEDPYGNIGVLDGCFALPGGSVLSPEQVITISAQDYRVFPSRTRREGNSWMAIRED